MQPRGLYKVYFAVLRMACFDWEEMSRCIGTHTHLRSAHLGKHTVPSQYTIALRRQVQIALHEITQAFLIDMTETSLRN